MSCPLSLTGSKIAKKNAFLRIIPNSAYLIILRNSLSIHLGPPVQSLFILSLPWCRLSVLFHADGARTELYNTTADLFPTGADSVRAGAALDSQVTSLSVMNETKWSPDTLISQGCGPLSDELFGCAVGMHAQMTFLDICWAGHVLEICMMFYEQNHLELSCLYSRY